MEIESKRTKLFIFGGIILSIFIFALDNMIISPSIPRILKEIGGGQYINWVFTAYLLTSTIATPIFGKLTDIYSRRKMFLLAIAIFVLASMLCGLSENIYQLIFFRGLQGIGGGAIMVSAISMIGEIFSIKERAKYQGYVGAVFALATIVGPIVGGFLTDMFSWRWAFYINLPLGIISFLILYYFIPKKLPQTDKAQIDYVGAVLLTLFLTPLVLSFSFMSSVDIINMQSGAMIFFAVLMFILFLAYEKRRASPIFSVALLSDRQFVIPAVMTFINAIIFFAAALYIQIYAQTILNMSIMNSGILFSAIILPLVLTSPLYGHLVARHGTYKKIVIWGSSVLFLSMVFFSIMLQGSPSLLSVVMHLIPIGIGMGAMMSIFNMIIQMVYPRERLGEVTGAMQLIRGIGGTVGTALLGFVFAYFVKDITKDFALITEAITVIFYVLVVLSGISLIASLFMKDGKGFKSV